MNTYTPKQVAEYLQTDVPTIHAMAHEGLLPKPCIDNGYITRWSIASINRLVAYHSLDIPITEGTIVHGDAMALLEPCDGNKVRFADFYDSYLKRVLLDNRKPHNNKFVIGVMRLHYLVGLGPNKVNYIGNVRFCETLHGRCGECKPQPSSPLFLSHKGRLVRA